MSAKHTGVRNQKQTRILIRARNAFAMQGSPGDNLAVENNATTGTSGTPTKIHGPFLPGSIVIATLCNPREKFWGMVLSLATEGVSLSGVELASFEDLAVMVRDGEPFTSAVVFFPMHRIERVELDLPDGNLPSLSQRFFAKTGLEPSAALAPANQGTAADSHGTQLHASEER
jgi:hypothetical protein